MVKKKSRQLPALLIGRFQPFHFGHLDVVKQMLARHPKIIIGIGSAQYSGTAKNPFSGSARAKMIRASLRREKIPAGRFAIVKIPDIHDDTRWVAHVEKLAAPFGAVWSGTLKVQKLFRKAKTHAVASPKFNFPISGTNIRRLMRQKKSWQHLVPCPSLCK